MHASIRTIRSGVAVRPLPVRALLVVALLLLTVSTGRGQTLESLTDGFVGAEQIQVRDVSADGSAACGQVTLEGASTHDAFWWTESGGFVVLPRLDPLFRADGWGISSDGQRVYGESLAASGSVPVVWTAGGAPSPLDYQLDGATAGRAYDASDDGTVVVGTLFGDTGQFGVIWTNGVPVRVEEGSVFSLVTAVDGAGTIAGGTVQPGDSFWYASGELHLHEGFVLSQRGITRDGSLMVGSSGSCPAIWTQTGGVTVIDARFGGVANAASDDGETIVGSASGIGAFRWTPEGIRSLTDILEESCVDTSAWDDLFTATAVSADGRVIVGYEFLGDHWESWRVTLPDPGGKGGVAGDVVDSDGDGLLDEWETCGIPYVDQNDVSQRFLIDLDGDGSSDADPQRRDLFVEVDAMTGMSLSDAAVEAVQAAFDDAPLMNPDGSEGITLHVLRDDAALPHVEEWTSSGCWPDDFDDYAASWYGTAAERGSPDAATILAVKRIAVRYCIVADESDSGAGGCGAAPGDNTVLYLGYPIFNDGSNDDIQKAAVFMHELGHNLGLQHGGHDEINGKPNYPSIMNYAMAYKYDWNATFWRLDYCRVGSETLGDLDETSLDETAGVGSAGGTYAAVFMPYGINQDDAGTTVRAVEYLPLDGSEVDFGDVRGTGFPDGDLDTGVAQDLNYVADATAGLPTTASPDDVHISHNDWENIVLATSAQQAGFAGPSYPTDELTIDAWQWINEHFPIPPGVCVADLTDDDVVDVADLLQMLSSWMTPDADVDNDGLTNVVDLLTLLGAWGPCP